MLGADRADPGAVPAQRPALPSLAAVGVAVAVALVCSALARGRGAAGFPTHPVALAALAAAAAHLLTRPRTRQEGGLVRLTGAGLGAYAALGVAASVASGTAAAVPLAAVWGAAWIPPLVTASAAAALARRGGRRWGGRRWGHAVRSLLVVGGLTTVATALVQEPVAPFTGLPPAAPGAWRSTGGPALDVLSAALLLGLVAVPVVLAADAARSPVLARRARSVLLALAAAAPLAVVAVCLLLAVARDPGGVDPSVGSAGFLVVLAAGCWAAGCAVLAVDGDDARRPALVAARCAAAAVVAITVLTGGVLAGALLDDAPLLAVVATSGLLAAAGLEGWRRASGWAGVLVDGPTRDAPASPPQDPPHDPTQDPHPHPSQHGAAPPPGGWSDLTPRERDVLAELSTGASNAGIAAALSISPRTVEAHLRSVFTRLSLDPDDGANRRVVVARLWLEHGPRG